MGDSSDFSGETRGAGAFRIQIVMAALALRERAWQRRAAGLPGSLQLALRVFQFDPLTDSAQAGALAAALRADAGAYPLAAVAEAIALLDALVALRDVLDTLQVLHGLALDGAGDDDDGPGCTAAFVAALDAAHDDAATDAVYARAFMGGGASLGEAAE